MEWNKVMNFGDPSTFGTEMADRFVGSGANLPSPVSNRVKLGYVYVSEYPNINCFETKLGKVRIFTYLIIHVSTDLRPM